METRIFRDCVSSYIRTDTINFLEDTSVDMVLNQIRRRNISDQIVYFYVVDNLQRLRGVLPLRRLLSASPEQLVGEVMVKNVVTVCSDDSIANTFKVFTKHKYLSLPVIDKEEKFVGVLDVTALTGGDLNPGQKQQYDEVFETIGIRSSVLSYLTPFSAFRHRFPWLVPTLLSGISCAVLSSLFESTIAESMVLAFFLTLILGLGESVGIQSLTITIRKLHVERPTWPWFIKAAKKEVITSLLLGLSTGSLIAGIIFFWKGTLMTGVAVGLSIMLSLLTATFFGLAVPSLLHKTRLDPKVSAGPLVLGLADLFTLFFYFSVAKMIL